MTDKILQPNEELLTKDAEKAQALSVVMSEITVEKLEMNQLLGRIQATHAISSMLEAISLSQLQTIKEQKAYKKYKGQTKEINGKIYGLDTWDGFCKAIGATSRSIDDKIENLRILGETALENAQNLGMTTRELRKLRKLDPSDQNVIIGELEASIGDKDAIVELIENMSAKHVKDKAELQEKLNEQTAERQADSKVIEAKNAKIDELERQIIKQETAEPMQKALVFAQLIGEIETVVGAEIGKLEKVFINIEQANSADQLPERLRINQGSALVAIKQWCDNLIDRYGLGDIGETDDGLDWAAEAQKTITDKQSEPAV